MDMYHCKMWFSSAQTSIMANIPEATLRTWRKRGLLPEDRLRNDGYDSLQVCALAIRKVMVSQGESPKNNILIANHAAAAVLFAALRYYPILLDIDYPPDDPNDRKRSSTSPRTIIKLMGTDGVVAAVTGEKNVVGWRYLVAVDRQPYEPASDFDGPLSCEAVSLRAIDLHALGVRLAALAPSPLVSLRWSDRSDFVPFEEALA